MHRILLILLFCSLGWYLSFGQVPTADSLMVSSDSVHQVVPDSGFISADTVASADTEMVSVPVANTEPEPGHEGHPRPYSANTVLFYSLLCILLVLGIFRYSNELFYKNLFRSFINTNNSFRHIRTQVGQRNFLHTLMNLIFFVITGIYLYYVVQVLHPQAQLLSRSPFLNIGMFSLSLIMVYGLKIGFLKLLGRLFEIDTYTDEYIFNILLINKILAVILFPILCFMVFASVAVAKIVTFLSFVIIGLAILNRYARSRESMAKLLKVNKFHFFIYLCASEILPFAVIGKFILANA